MHPSHPPADPSNKLTRHLARSPIGIALLPGERQNFRLAPNAIHQMRFAHDVQMCGAADFSRSFAVGITPRPPSCRF